MNGDFERDKGAYPFAALAIGNDFKVAYMPALETLSSVPLSHAVAANAALRLNTAYYAGKAGGAKPDLTSPNVRKIIGEEVTAAVRRGDLDGARATQIQQLLDAEV